MTSTIDISTSVSAADHEKVYRSLLDQFEDWRNQHGWCTDLYLYVAQLSTVFHWDRYGTAYPSYDGEMKYDPSRIEDTDEARARDLRELRGRILRFTIESPDYLDVRLANTFLTTAGLAPWSAEAQETPKHRYYVQMTAYIDSDLPEDEVMTKLTRSFTRQGLVPGTLGTRHYEENITPPSSVPAADTVILLRHPGSH